MNKYIFIVSIEHPGDRKTALAWLRSLLAAGISDTEGYKTELDDLVDGGTGQADITILNGDQR